MLALDRHCRCESSRNQRHLGSRPLRRAVPTTRLTRATAQASADAPNQCLQQAAADQAFGASSSAQQKQSLLQLIADIKRHSAAGGSSAAPTEGPLAGSWQLLWTSEASVHSIVRGQLLGARVTDIQQCIDLQGQRVTNTISFGVSGLQLQASGPLKVLSPSRIYYSFDRLRLRLLQLWLPLPVVFKGGGWTDCVLLLPDGDTDVRVMENSRGDTLVLQRCSLGA